LVRDESGRHPKPILPDSVSKDNMIHSDDCTMSCKEEE
jgi:hypothetical protein